MRMAVAGTEFCGPRKINYMYPRRPTSGYPKNVASFGAYIYLKLLH